MMHTLALVNSMAAMAGPGLLALSFANPLLLGGLGLIVAPIIIHYLSRRQYRRVRWGATRFLLEAEKENRRRVRFEQWLLLVLRCAAMALLAFLIARPFVQPGALGAVLGRSAAANRVIVIDDSASLASRHGASSDFGQVKAAAQRLVEWLGQEASADPVTVFRTSAPNEPLIDGTPLSGTAAAELQRRIERLSPAQVPGRASGLLSEISAKAADAADDRRTDVYILSDFQRSDWVNGETGAGRGAFEPLARRNADALRVVLVPVAPLDRENVAVTGVDLDRRRVVTSLPATVTAEVTNYSPRPRRGLSLQVERDGQPLPAATIDVIPPFATRSVAVETPFPEAGFRRVEVRLTGTDGLPLDDVRRLTVEVREQLRVLMVNGQPATDPYRDEVHLLRTALSPPGTFSSGVQVDVVDPLDLEGVNLAAYDVVMLCNMPTPSETAVTALERYVRSGGGLAVFLGSELHDVDDFNRLLYRNGAGLLPARITRLRTVSEGDEGEPLIRTAAEHPVTAQLAPPNAEIGSNVRFWAYFRTDLPDADRTGEPGAGGAPELDGISEAPGPVSKNERATQRDAPAPEVLARFADAEGTPALLERGFGKGRVLLFTSTVDMDWNNWARALDGSFVVAAVEMAYHLAGGSERGGAFAAGQRLPIDVDPEMYEPFAVVRAPAEAGLPPIEARPAEEDAPRLGELLTLWGPRATRLGFWTVVLDATGGEEETRPLAVNLPAEESDLRAATPAELSAALRGVEHEVTPVGAGFLGNEREARQELWPALLLGLIAVLMGEQCLAWWFGTPGWAGRPRRRGSTTRFDPLMGLHRTSTR